jgi:uncharacterized protein (TIGR02145 family)
VGEYASADRITFTGTPPYDIVFSGNGGSLSINGSDYTIPPGVTIASFTDKTGAPGTFTCMPPATYTLSGLDVCLNTTVTLTLSGSQSGWKYQLYKGSTAIGAVVNGTGIALTFSEAASATGTFNYTVQTVDPTGTQCEMLVSDVRSITVTANPVISAQPVATSVCSGGAVTLSVTASPVTAYWWRKNGSATSEGSNYTSAAYTTAALTAGATYSVVVANGSCSVTSDNAVVSMMTDATAPGATVNFTTFNPCPNATTGTTWTLQDTRESGNNQSYKVRKMADGHIWMVQDMKFGDLCGTTTFTGSTADQTGKVSSIGMYYGDCRDNIFSGAGAGYLYDWAATINKSGAYVGSTLTVGCSGTASGTSGTAPGACQGICPVGWHIPTGSVAGEFQALHDAIGGCSLSNDDCWNAASAWEGVKGGRCDNSGFNMQGGIGYYWSSTYYTTDNAYSMAFYSDAMYPGTLNNDYKDFGLSVRCIRNY